MIRVFGYLKASISQTSGEVEICITSALKGKPCQVSNDILETLFALQVPDNGVNSQSKRETFQIHRLCMTGLSRETPIYPKNKKNVNCISARCKHKALLIF